MGLDGIFYGALDEAPPCGYSRSAKSDFVVGLEEFCSRKRCPSLRRKAWGVGKTTMAVAFFDDQEIKGVGWSKLTQYSSLLCQHSEGTEKFRSAK